ncbi:hypothetical protein [Mycoplasma sp. 4044]
MKNINYDLTLSSKRNLLPEIFCIELAVFGCILLFAPLLLLISKFFRKNKWISKSEYISAISLVIFNTVLLFVSSILMIVFHEQLKKTIFIGNVSCFNFACIFFPFYVVSLLLWIPILLQIRYLIKNGQIYKCFDKNKILNMDFKKYLSLFVKDEYLKKIEHKFSKWARYYTNWERINLNFGLYRRVCSSISIYAYRVLSFVNKTKIWKLDLNGQEKAKILISFACNFLDEAYIERFFAFLDSQVSKSRKKINQDKKE